MWSSFLIGLVGGQRALTPLAAVSVAASRGGLAVDGPMLGLLANKLAAAAAVVLALGEMAADKQRTAPDRIVPIGLLARFTTSAIAGAALAPGRRVLGAFLGGGTAMAAAYPGWRLRIASMERYGQMATGLVEDAAVLLGAVAILRGR